MLNGVTQICITKIDVLNTFEELKMATAYRYDGAESDELPYDMSEMRVEPVYKAFKGWMTELDENPQYSTLPKDLIDFVDFLEDYLKTPVTMISTGPEREKLILK